jgi:biotin carboxylase
MLRALDNFTIEGPTTLLPFYRELLATPQWQRGETARDLIADRAWLKGLAPVVA